MPDAIRIERDVEMKARDGVILRADIVRPERPDRVPAIVCRTPYDKALRLASYAHLRAFDAAANGFAVVFQDIRGRFASDGDWALMGWDQVERADGYDCVEWVAGEPWCDGRVGMMGGSYEALNALAAAEARPPSLRAIAPALVGSANARLTTRMLEGVVLSWSALIAIDVIEKRAARGQVDGADMGKAMGALVDPARIATTLPLDELPPLTIPGMPSFRELTERLMASSATVTADLDQIEVPALWTTGWWDQAGGSDLFREVRARGATSAAREMSRLIVGPWSHTQHDVHLGDLGFGQLASLQGGGIGAAHIDFFTRHLGAAADPSPPTVRYFLTGTNAWRDDVDWPPPSGVATPLYLHSDGALLTRAPEATAASDHYVYDPADPVPSIGFRALNLGGSTVPGPFDQRRVESRGDVLVYTSAALDTTVEVVGDPAVELFVSTDAPDTDFVAKLCDVDSHGISRNIADGLVRLCWSDDGREPREVAAGDVVPVTIALGLVGHAFLPGHRIRLQVTSSAFPHFDRNLNTGNPPGSETAGMPAKQAVYRCQGSASRLMLPVLTGRVDQGDRDAR
ncbi:MAG: CocE/NonD family hydrolase [Actinobacteria bacterium]|nr:CocE/NonD family hydrolase [Actinomycetota bacterium]MBV9936047.1 CocE/NonD family hydrolase [Actinomycetota bacterium]